MVRKYAGNDGPFQVLNNVTSFNHSCAASISKSGSKTHQLAIAGVPLVFC